MLKLPVLFCLVAFLSACEANGDDPGGPTTLCTYGYTAPANPGDQGVGAKCEEDLDCASGVCLEPGEDGNDTNILFAFCTRGCDCNRDSDASLTSTEQATLLCLEPQKDDSGAGDRHAVPKCSSLQDCLALNADWTDCREPYSGAGAAVCHAGR